MSILVKCKCGKTLSVKPESAGRKGKCPVCGAIFLIPAAKRPEARSVVADTIDKKPANASLMEGIDNNRTQLSHSPASAQPKLRSEKHVKQHNAALSIICKCGKKLYFKPEIAGKTGKCPGCGKQLSIPTIKKDSMSLAIQEIYSEANPLESNSIGTAQLPEVHQLDNDVFLVENLSKMEIFERLRSAIQENHILTGAFPRSFILRGSGNSGITFALHVIDHEEGTVFTIAGDTPQGPANFEVWFNPLTISGWGLCAVTELFNAHANATAAARVHSDFQMLLINILTAFGAEHILVHPAFVWVMV